MILPAILRRATVLRLMLLVAGSAVIFACSEFWLGRVPGGLEFQWVVTLGPCRAKATAITRDHWYELRLDFDPRYRFAR